MRGNGRSGALPHQPVSAYRVPVFSKAIMEQEMIEALNLLLGRHRSRRENVLWLLQDIQTHFGYIPEEAVDWFAERLDIPTSRFFGVITFYPKFRMRPAGRNTLTVCCGAACHIKGGRGLLETARNSLGLPPGEDTSSDLSFTLQEATCIGACNIAPVAILNDRVYGDVDPRKISALIEEHRSPAPEGET